MEGAAGTPGQIGWHPGVNNLPLDTDLAASVQFLPVLGGISGEPDAVIAFFTKLRARDPPIQTCADLRDKITWPVLNSEARNVVHPATIKTLARLIEPSGPYKWPAAAPGLEKRKPGGNGNCKPTTTLEQQCAAAGVPQLDAQTFRWPAATFEGVPKKGEAASINEHVGTLFDNTWLVQNKVSTAPCARARCRPLTPPVAS